LASVARPAAPRTCRRHLVAALAAQVSGLWR
jgi:hypothetical protein